MVHRWGLTTENDVADAALHLLKRSAGNPRVVVDLLMEHRTFESLKKEPYPELSYAKWKGLHQHLRRYRSQLREWFIDEKVVDLRQSVEDIEKARVTPARILQSCRVEWEGNLEKAKVFAKPQIKHEIVLVVYPLREYVKYVADIFEYLSPDSNEVFRWMCIKRWSELFSETCVPKDKLPTFFKANTIFGEYDSVRFSEDVAVLPKILRGQSYSTLVYAHLLDDAERAYAGDHWPQIMRETSEMLDAKEDESFCYKFRPQSLWPSAFLITRTRTSGYSPNGARKRPRETYSYKTLAVGMVIKDARSEEFGVAKVHEECKHFDKMFSELERETKASFGVMTNVLFVCVIGCSDELKNVFGEKGAVAPPSDCTHMSEVLLLDLTTSEKRAQFFGFECQRNDDDDTRLLMETTEKIVA